MARSSRSAPLRVRLKPITCTSSLIRSVIRLTASVSGLRRPAKVPSSGGFHRTKYFSPAGEPSRAISSTDRPVSLEAWSAGLAMVAEEQTNCGRAP